MAGESITFNFLSHGADSLAQDFRKTGDNAALAAKGARLCADALEKQRKAAAVSAGATLALAKADDILKEAEQGLAEGALEAEFALKRQAAAAKQAGIDAAAAEAGVSALAGGGGIPGGGLGAVIAAGVALSPVIATLGVGLGGLGLAALGVAKNQKLMATELAPLKAEFAGFTKALQPEVLKLFGTGIKIAGGLLHDIQPVAAATGKAFDGLLGRVDAEFRSGTWQQFFGFMASTAGPDIKLLGDNFISLMRVLPGLLEALQPVASLLLQVTNAGLGAIGMVEQLVKKTRQAGGGQPTIWDEIKGGVGWVEKHVPAGNKSIGQLAEGWLGMTKAAGAAGKATAGAGDAFKGAWPKAQSYAQWVQASAVATTNLANAQNAAVSTQLAYGNDILTSANDAETFRQKLKASAGQIGLHTQAQRDSFGAANTYIGDLARQATTAIASGHGTDAAITAIRNGLPALDAAKTKNKQYWQEVRTLDDYLHKLELIKFISTPIHVTGTGKWSVTGTSITPGVAHGPQNIGAAPTSTGAATGLYINRGTGPTADDVMIRASRGELIVPANMVRAGAVDHLRGAIPGFAAGGVAGSYGPGRVAGLPPWISGRINATDTAIAQNTAQAIVNAMAAAQAAAKAAQTAFGTHVPNVGSGVARWRGVVDQALRMEGLSTAFDSRVLYQMMTESGGNPNAINLTDINAQHGDPSRGLMQVIGSTFRAYHWPGTSWNIYDPLANIAAAINYARHVYGPQLGNQYGGIGSGHGYALGGLIPGFASGGVAGQGAAWLKAWQSRHGGGFGAAWGPTVLNQQIPEMAAAIARAKALSGASGLSPGQHRFWAAAAADETRRLGVLRKELVTERAWRDQLGINELGLDKQIRAAGNIPSLAGPARGWKTQLKHDKATVTAISKMLGYSDAYIKAHPAAIPPVTGVQATHSYGGDVANNLGVVLAAALGPFTGAARGGMVFDRGGTLQPGYNGIWNMTGRPEPLVPARGGGGRLQIEWVGGNGGDDLERWIRKNVRIRGGGDVQRAYGSR